MKPIFDGVYINQILLQAQVPSALQRVLVSLSLSFSLSLSDPSSSLHRTRVQNPLPPFVPLTVRSSNSPLKPSQKGGYYLLDGF